MSGGAIAGIVVGSVAGVALLAVAGLLLYRRKQKQQRLERHQAAESRVKKWEDRSTGGAASDASVRMQNLGQ